MNTVENCTELLNIHYFNTFLIDEEGNVEQVFNKFKTKEHHLVILNYLNNGE